jgi:hypothetical protein
MKLALRVLLVQQGRRARGVEAELISDRIPLFREVVLRLIFDLGANIS